MVSEASVVSVPAGLEVATLDGEAIILNVNTGNYYGLNALGAHLFARLSEPCRVSTLVDHLLAEYDVERSILAADLVAFLEDLAQHQLITVEQTTTA